MSGAGDGGKRGKNIRLDALPQKMGDAGRGRADERFRQADHIKNRRAFHGDSLTMKPLDAARPQRMFGVQPSGCRQLGTYKNGINHGCSRINTDSDEALKGKTANREIREMGIPVEFVSRGSRISRFRILCALCVLSRLKNPCASVVKLNFQAFSD